MKKNETLFIDLTSKDVKIDLFIDGKKVEQEKARKSFGEVVAYFKTFERLEKEPEK